MEALGFSAKLLKPISITSSVSALASSAELASLVSDYDRLCDFFHHNASSHFASSPGFRMGDVAVGINGPMVTKAIATISRYEYPNVAKAKKAVEDTVNTVVRAATSCASLVHEFPRSPFPKEQIEEMTGNEYGMPVLRNAHGFSEWRQE